MDLPLDTIAQLKATALDLAIHFGPRLVTALAILGVGVMAGRWIGRALERALRRLEMEPPVRILLVRVARLLVLALFAIMALQNLGVELLPLVAGLGVLGAGVALATQGVLSNVAAGLTIIFTKPFRVGEYIAIIGCEGEVTAIGLFSTILVHPDLSQVVIPNRKIAGEVLHNYGRVRQLDLSVGVAYGSDLAAATAAVQAVLRDNPRVLRDPAPVVQVDSLADSAVVIGIRPWVPVAEHRSAGGEVLRAVAEAFAARGIVVPFPQREVRLLPARSSDA